MKILFLGDISGRPGREVVKKFLPEIINKYSPDFVIANAENSAGGRGITRKVLNDLMSYGVNFFTAGEHIWAHREFRDDLISGDLPIVRPYNYEATDEIPGVGYKLIDMGSKQLLVMNFIGQTFMRENVRNPFWAFDELWENLVEKGTVSKEKSDNPIIIIDFHAEATSEKISFAWYIRSRVSGVIGTHTHVPTADERILDSQCAFVTDAGMCGPYEASLWVDFSSVIHNFRYPYKEKFEMKEDGVRVFNSVLIHFENKTPQKIERIDRIIQ